MFESIHLFLKYDHLVVHTVLFIYVFWS